MVKSPVKVAHCTLYVARSSLYAWCGKRRGQKQVWRGKSLSHKNISQLRGNITSSCVGKFIYMVPFLLSCCSISSYSILPLAPFSPVDTAQTLFWVPLGRSGSDLGPSGLHVGPSWRQVASLGLLFLTRSRRLGVGPARPARRGVCQVRM